MSRLPKVGWAGGLGSLEQTGLNTGSGTKDPEQTSGTNVWNERLE